MAAGEPKKYTENLIFTDKDNTFVISQPYKITEISCFLLFRKYDQPSQIWLLESNHQKYGPWSCQYNSASNWDPKTNMTLQSSSAKVTPNAVIPPGTYTVCAANENIIKLSFFDDTAARQDRYHVPANRTRAQPEPHPVTVVVSIHATPVPQAVDGDSPWTVAVGVAGLAAALATIAVAVALGRKLIGPKSHSGKQDPPARYILQLSADKLEIIGAGTATLTVTAYRVDSQGTLSPAPTAHLQIQPPPTAGGLHISPSQGQGQMQSTISVAARQKEETWMLTVRGQIAGTLVETYLQLKVTPGYFVEVY